MPTPVPGGRLDDLRRWLNVETEADFRLTVSWLLACYRHRGPYPILVISSSQGSGKSTLTRLLIRLIDPQRADVRSPAKDERDLWVAAQNARLLAYDNLSVISKDMADAFCRISTGGTFATRTLHSNADETVLRACLPVLLNSITEVVNRPDMMDRALVIETRHISESERRTEEDLWREFADEEPRLLGAIFDAVSAAHGAYHETPVPRQLRMADAARWAMAAAPSLNWSATELADWWRRNRIAGQLAVLEGDAVAIELVAHLQKQGDRWEGAVTALYELLTDAAPERVRRSKYWPTSALSLRSRITRLRDPLATSGWAFEARKGTRGARVLIFTRVGSA